MVEDLISAISASNDDLLRSLLADAADVNQEDERGRTPLSVAAAVGSASATKLVLTAGADPNYACVAVPPLIEASERGDSEIVSMLLAAGADVEATNEDGDTAVMVATRRGRLGVVSTLVDAGASVTSPSPAGEIALAIAVTYGRTSVANYLLPLSGPVERQWAIQKLSDQAASLRRAGDAMASHAEQGTPIVERSTKAPGGEVAVTPETDPLRRAAFLGDIRRLEELLAAGADPDGDAMGDEEGEDEHRPLMFAVAGGNVSAVKMLIEAGASVLLASSFSTSPITVAASAGNGLIVDLLAPFSLPEHVLEAQSLGATPGIGISRERVRMLLDAAERGDADVVERLLGEGVPVDATDEWGTTALMRASNLGRLGLVEMLLARGADPSHQNAAGDTALSQAAKGGSLMTFEYLYPRSSATARDQSHAAAQVNRAQPTQYPDWQAWYPPPLSEL